MIGLLSSRTFSRKEFVELPTGQVRLMPQLARDLATSTLLSWERMASAHSETIARTLAMSVGGEIRIPTSTTRGALGKGRATLARAAAKASAPSKVPSACRECGVLLSDPERQYCRDCLPTFKVRRTEKLVDAARQVLAEMRASADDPARSVEAKTKQVAANTARRAGALAWEKKNPGPHNEEEYRRELLPRLAEITIPRMMQATGLTSSYCWRIKRGERVPHPMYWERLRSVIGHQESKAAP